MNDDGSSSLTIQGADSSSADFEYISYPGVTHSFTCKRATEKGKKFKLPLKYDAQEDVDSWAKTLKLLKDVF